MLIKREEPSENNAIGKDLIALVGPTINGGHGLVEIAMSSVEPSRMLVV